MNNFLLYIDPGTGSMLFSILIGAAATLFFVAKAAWIKLKILLSGKKDGSGVADVSYKTYVIYNEGNQYWNVFKPVADEFEKYRRSITANIEVFMKELYSLSKKDIGRYINTVNGELYEYKTPYEMAELFDVVKDMDKLKQQSQFSYRLF